MSRIWTRSDGKIIKGDDGKILVCDDCPCGDECSDWADSYMTVNSALGTTAIVTKVAYPPYPAIMASLPACADAYFSSRSTYCMWIGATVSIPTWDHILHVNPGDTLGGRALVWTNGCPEQQGTNTNRDFYGTFGFWTIS